MFKNWQCQPAQRNMQDNIELRVVFISFKVVKLQVKANQTSQIGCKTVDSHKQQFL
jgi:hypothetical protein